LTIPRFHPSVKRAKAIVESGEIGDIKHISADLLLNQSMFPEDDIRYDFELGGGAMMDLGCTYVYLIIPLINLTYEKTS